MKRTRIKPRSAKREGEAELRAQVLADVAWRRRQAALDGVRP